MANLSNQPRGRGLPAMPAGRPIAAYRTYEQAQRAVDFLSDNRFPVQFVAIVGNDLKMVERVTGRLTYSRVALAGLLSGAYWGLFLGMLFSLFDNRSLGATLPAMAALGAGFGMIFGLLSYAATGGRRDFTSTSQIVAAEYAVWCGEEHIGPALQLLQQLPDDHRLSAEGTRRPVGGPYRPGPGQGDSYPSQTGQGPQSGPDAPQPGPNPAAPAPWAGGATGPAGATDPSSWSPGPSQGRWPAAPGQYPPPEEQPAGAHPTGQQPAAPPAPSGPTYGEMMERKRQERLAAERERQRGGRPDQS